VCVNSTSYSGPPCPFKISNQSGVYVSLSVCPDSNFWTKWPLTYISGIRDTILVKFKDRGHRSEFTSATNVAKVVCDQATRRKRRRGMAHPSPNAPPPWSEAWSRSKEGPIPRSQVGATSSGGFRVANAICLRRTLTMSYLTV